MVVAAHSGNRSKRTVQLVAACFMLAVQVGCSKPGSETPKPVPPITLPESKPAVTSPPVSQPASKPATKPEAPSKPASTFDPHPPFRVDLHVESPLDPQPGWLRVKGLDAKGEPATAQGVMAEPNLMTVDTHNVQKIEVRFGELPLTSGKRLILRIDKQGIELRRDKRQSVTLERRRTGAWDVRPSE